MSEHVILICTPQNIEDLWTAVETAYADDDAPIFDEDRAGGEKRVAELKQLLAADPAKQTYPPRRVLGMEQIIEFVELQAEAWDVDETMADAQDMDSSHQEAMRVVLHGFVGCMKAVARVLFKPRR